MVTHPGVLEMETNILKYMAFVESVRHGSFTKAAETLGCSQSGVSRMVADLEHDWNVKLMERGRNGIELTPEGRDLFGYASDLCGSYDSLRSRVEEINGLDIGHIRIGTFSSIATHWLPRLIRMFKNDHPGVDYEILMGDYSEIEAWIRDGRVDFGFLPMRDGLDLDTRFVMRDRLMAVIPVDHPMADREEFPLEEFSREPFMLLEKGGRAEISEVFERNGVTPQVSLTTWDDYAIMSMVENGLGISILPELILRRAPYRIVTLPLDVPAHRDICVAMRSRDRMSNASMRFLGYLDKVDDA